MTTTAGPLGPAGIDPSFVAIQAALTERNNARRWLLDINAHPKEDQATYEECLRDFEHEEARLRSLSRKSQ